MSIYEALLESAKQTTSHSSNKPSVPYVSEDTSIFEYTLSLLEEVNNTVSSEHLSSFNEGILADTISPVLASRFNFNRLMSDMINLNVDSINKVYSKSEAIMKQVAKSDDRIKPHTNEIINFNDSFRMNEPFYKFTNLGVVIPPYDLDKRVDDEFRMIIQKVKDIVSDDRKSNMEKEDNILTLYMNISGDAFSKTGTLYTTKNQYKLDEKLLKGILDSTNINTSLLYSSTDSYEKQVYAFFRNGSLEPNVEVVTANDVHEAFDIYNNSKNTIRELNTAKTELIKSYQAIKKATEKAYIDIYALLPTENMKIYMDKIMRYEVVKTMYYLNGYDLLYAARLDANIHAMLQSKKICLYTVNIIMNGKIKVESFDYVSKIYNINKEDASMDDAFFDSYPKEIVNSYDTDSTLREYAYDNYRISLDNLSDVLALENSIDLLKENTDIVLEGKIFDSIKRAISNWIKNTSLAWKRFKELSADKKYTDYIHNNMKLLAVKNSLDPPDEFEIPQINEIEKFCNLDIPIFDEKMIDSLNTKEDFIKSSYMNAFAEYRQDGKSIKEVAMEKCFKKAADIPAFRVNVEQIEFYIEFIDKYHQRIDSITKNIESINRASQVCIDAIKSIDNGSTTNESSLDYYLREDDNNSNNSNSGQQQSTAQPNQANTNTNNNTNNANDNKNKWTSDNTDNKEAKAKAQSDMIKKINNYYGVATEVLSAGMAICNKGRDKMFTIIKKYAEMNKEAAGGNTKEKNTGGGETKINGDVPQVDIK